MTGWARALDELERTLEEQRACLASGDFAAFPAYVPPPGLGPLPDALAARAVALLAAGTELCEQISSATTAAQRELAMLSRVRPSAASSSYVDVTL